MSILKTAKQGFTLVELSLATLFLAILMLMIATITINVSVIYQKGLSLRNVNTTGRVLTDDIERSINSAPILRLENDFPYYRTRTGTATVQRVNSEPLIERNAQYGGVFCSGRYSYVWNTGYILNGERYSVDDEPIQIFYTDPGREPTTPYLVKFADPTRAVCDVDIQNVHRVTAPSEPEELLSQTNVQIRLAVYEMTIFRPVQDSFSWRTFYAGTFVLATLTGDVSLQTGDFCDPVNNQSLAGDFSYCAVNKFNFAAQASEQK